MHQPSEKNLTKPNRRLASLMKRRDFMTAAAGLGFLGATPSEMFATKPSVDSALEICLQVLKLYTADVKEIDPKAIVEVKKRFRPFFDNQINAKNLWETQFDYVLTNAKMIGIAARRFAHQANEDVISESTLTKAVDAVVGIARASQAKGRPDIRDAWCMLP